MNSKVAPHLQSTANRWTASSCSVLALKGRRSRILAHSRKFFGARIVLCETLNRESNLASLLKVERNQMAARGPHFCVMHRVWQPCTICSPGEAIAQVYLWHRRERISVPPGGRTALLFGYLARHQHLGQSATQTAAGLSVDPFTRQHGAHSGVKELSKRVSRTTVKMQIKRLREGLRRTFRKAGLNLNADRVLISEKTTVNEVRYRLKASVSCEHAQFKPDA